MQAANSLRLVTVLDARNVSDDHAFSSANKAELEAPSPCFVLDRSIAGDIFGHFGKALDSHCTFHALRAGDDADADPLCVPHPPRAGRGTDLRSGRTRRFGRNSAFKESQGS